MSDYLRDFLFLLGPFRRRALMVMVLLVAASFLDLCGIGLVWPYVAILSHPQALEGLPVWESFTQLTGIHSSQGATTVLGLLIVAVFYTKAIVHFRIYRYIVEFGSQHYVHCVEWLTDLYKRAPYEYFVGRSTRLLNKQVYEAQIFGLSGLVPALRLCAEGIVGIAVIALLALIDIKAVGVLAAIMGTLLVVYDRRYRRRSAELGQAFVRSQTDMVGEIGHLGDMLKELRVFGAEQYFLERVRERAHTIGVTRSEHAAIQFLPRYVVDSAMVTFVVLVATAATFSDQATQSVIATLGVFGAAGARLIPSVNQIAANTNELRFAREPTAALRQSLQELMALARAAPQPRGEGEQLQTFEQLTLSDVEFRYAGGPGPALQSIDLSIRAGDTIGIIGTSGAGKTTLIDVLLGLLVPQAGTVLVNGSALAKNLADWHRMVGYLPQNAHLTDATIRQNVALGQMPADVDDDAVWGALERARLRDHVETLPGGLDTLVGEDGANLSGGQRARVALARAFYFGRQVFVLDEATASLDQETETEIVAEIQRLKGDKTLIVIAHRLSTVRHCEVIHRLEAGRIVASGSYASVVGSTSPASPVAAGAGGGARSRG